MKQTFMLDASVACKIFLDEPGREKVLVLFGLVATEKIVLIAPRLFLYETVNVLQRAKLSDSELERSVRLLFGQLGKTISLVDPEPDVFLKALELCEIGHNKSGFPTLYDAIYHALALCRGAVFLTADHKHFSKTKKLGSITLLEDVILNDQSP